MRWLFEAAWQAVLVRDVANLLVPELFPGAIRLHCGDKISGAAVAFVLNDVVARVQLAVGEREGMQLAWSGLRLASIQFNSGATHVHFLYAGETLSADY